MTRPYQPERQSKYLGILPEDWVAVPFGQIVSSSQYGLNSLASESGRYTMLRMKNLQDGAINTNDLVYVDLDDEEAAKYLLEDGDFLLNRTNSADLIGKTALFELKKPFVFASYLIRFKINKTKADPRFVNYFLNSEKGEQRLKSFSTKGASQVNLNPTTLKIHYYIPLPPLPEQRKIAEILSTWDRAIELTEQLIAAKQRRKQALMQRLLTGKVRFPGFAEPWEEVRLVDVCLSLKGGGTPSTEIESFWKGDIPWITGADFGDMSIATIRRHITEEAVANSASDIAPKGSLLVVSRTGVGKLAIAPVRIAYSQDITGIVLDEKKVDTFYVLYSLESSIPRLARFNQGTSINGVTRTDLKNHRIKIGPIDEQRRIGAVLRHAVDEVTLLRSHLDVLHWQKKGLMQQLLTGKWRVKV